MKLTPIQLFIALAAFFVAVKTVGFNFEPADENIYFYMGKMVAEGNMPYRDFFLAHPPLGIIINAGIFLFSGFNFIALKGFPTAAAVISGYILFKTVSRLYDGWTALLSAALFLLSYDVLRAANHPTGVDVTVLFMLLSYHYFIQRMHLLSGLLLGVAVSAGLYAVVLLGSFLVYLAWKKADAKAEILPLVGGFSIIFLAVNAFFYLIAGEGYIDSVYLYHINKVARSDQNMSTFYRIIWNNPLLFAAPFLLPLLVKKVKKRDAIYLQAIAALSYVLFLLNVKTLYDFYFMLLFPFLAMMSAKALQLLVGRGGRALNVAAVILLLYSGWSVSNYVKHESDPFLGADDIGRYVKTVTSEKDEIFGDSTTAPLIALLSGRKIALNEIDTNTQRFRSNTTDINQLFKRLSEDRNFKLFITQKNHGIEILPETKNYIKQNCKPLKEFKEKNRQINMYDCGG